MQWQGQEKHSVAKISTISSQHINQVLGQDLYCKGILSLCSITHIPEESSEAIKCSRNFSKISSSDILGFFFCFSVFRARASAGAGSVSAGEMGDVATSRVGVTGSGSITDRVYTCIVGARI